MRYYINTAKTQCNSKVNKMQTQAQVLYDAAMQHMHAQDGVHVAALCDFCEEHYAQLHDVAFNAKLHDLLCYFCADDIAALLTL